MSNQTTAEKTEFGLFFSRDWLLAKKVPAIQIIARIEALNFAIKAYESGDPQQVEFIKRQLAEYRSVVVELP